MQLKQFYDIATKVTFGDLPDCLVKSLPRRDTWPWAITSTFWKAGRQPERKQDCLTKQHSRDEYYTADSLRTLFETVPEACIVEFLREAGFFNLIWMAIYPEQLLV